MCLFLNTDKLDGKISDEFYEEKSEEWRQEQADILATMGNYQDANANYLEQGIHILELAQKAFFLYVKQQPAEKR